jgi:hypothetical protein
MSTQDSRNTPDLLLLIPIVLYVAAAYLFADWIVDDAGISYAYARNLAEGHGLVSQPGRAPVEGYTNFTWVVLLAPFFLLGLFDPVITPKVIGTILVVTAFVLLKRTLDAQLGSRGPALLATTLIAVAPPIVIWTASGLENSLTLLLAVVLFVQLVRRPRYWELQAGVTTALLAMTHPEHVLFVGAGLVACAAAGGSLRRNWRAAVGGAARYMAAFVAVFGPFMAMRLAIFGLPFPHPYYAKRVYPSLTARLIDMAQNPGAVLEKLYDVCRAVGGGHVGAVLVLVSTAAAMVLVARRRGPRALGIALAMEVVGIGAYVFIDADWMGEYRFATAATVFALVVLALSGFLALAPVLRGRARRVLVACAVAVVAVAYTSYVPRLFQYAHAPATTFADIANEVAFKFDAYANILGLPHATVFVADVGATLYYSRLTVYDAAGLSEPDVVRTLKKGTIYWLDEHPEFYDYIFVELKPTFIRTMAFFTQITAFERDPRFWRDYVAINAYDDDYVKLYAGRLLHSGDFVRRDALGTVGIDVLRAAYRPPRRPPPLADRVLEQALSVVGREAPSDPATLMAAGIRARQSLPGDSNGAARFFERVLELQPDHDAARYQLAAALDMAWRVSAARPVWEDVLRRATKVGDTATAAIARHRLYLDAPGHATAVGD